MDRKSFTLAVLSCGNGRNFTPVQVQKLFFIFDREIAAAVGGPHFHFEAYHYGPFDKTVYTVLEDLSEEGLVEIQDSRILRKYKLTPQGQAAGEGQLKSLAPKIRDYIQRLVEYVQNRSFAELVSAVYRAYPEMKVNSVFNS